MLRCSLPLNRKARRQKSSQFVFKQHNTKALSWNEIRRFSYRQGLDRNLVTRFLELVQKDLHNCGPEWTVGKIKGGRDALRAYVAHSYDKSWLKSNHIRKTTAGNFAAVFGQLQKLCHSEVGFVKVMNLLQIASAFMSSTCTPKQIKKFLDAVQTSIPVGTPDEYTEIMVEVAKQLPKLPIDRGCDVITSPALKQSHDERLISEWMSWSRSPNGLQTVTSDWFLPFITGPSNLLAMMGFRGGYSRDEHPVGTIHVTQEAGYKLRCYAAPMIWTQVCLEPLKKFLMNHLKQAPWDLTHNQRGKDTLIQERLAQHSMVYCYDLSNASDLIPWDSQEAILRTIVPEKSHHFIDLFKMVARGKWKFAPTGELVSWHRGQPLGSGPSFGSFALWHGLLLLALNGGQHDDKFFIVGDDVIILDDTLAEFYEIALDDLNLEWSPLKTLKSNRVAEFTGTLFTDKGIYKCPKWKKFTRDNFVDNLFNNGYRFLDFVPKKVKPVVEAVASLPEPWGIGYNPNGLSFDDRVKGLYHLLIPDKEIIPRDLSPADRVHVRLSGLTSYESDMFRPVATSRSFRRNLVEAQKAAQRSAYESLSEEKRLQILPDLQNLTSLVWLQEKEAQDSNSCELHSNLPRARAQIKIDKRLKDKTYPQLDSLVRRFKDLALQ